MTRKSRTRVPLSEDDDDALMARVAEVAQAQGLPSLTPQTTPPQAREAQQLKTIKLLVPDYLFRELTVQAATKGVTKKYLILRALQEAGYRVDPADLEEDGRRLR